MDAGPQLGARQEPLPHASPLAEGANGSAEPATPETTSVEVDDPSVPGPASNGRAPKALVLNATMEPLCVVAARRALVLVLASKADVIHSNGHRFRSEHLELTAPSVVRLRRYVHVPYRRRAALSRRGVFLRDGQTCQYCGQPAENVDHVVPRSRGGAHEWENVVAACRRCNSRKKDRTPVEASMTLSREPYAPQAAFWLIVSVGSVQPDWQAYLGDVLDAAG